MPTARLTEATWLAYESGRVKSALLANLPHGGLPVEEAVAILARLGLRYSDVELGAIADRLVADGVIEILP